MCAQLECHDALHVHEPLRFSACVCVGCPQLFPPTSAACCMAWARYGGCCSLPRQRGGCASLSPSPQSCELPGLFAEGSDDHHASPGFARSSGPKRPCEEEAGGQRPHRDKVCDCGPCRFFRTASQENAFGDVSPHKRNLYRSEVAPCAPNRRAPIWRKHWTPAWNGGGTVSGVFARPSNSQCVVSGFATVKLVFDSFHTQFAQSCQKWRSRSAWFLQRFHAVVGTSVDGCDVALRLSTSARHYILQFHALGESPAEFARRLRGLRRRSEHRETQQGMGLGT